MSLRHTTGRIVGSAVAVALLGLAVPGQSSASASATDGGRGASISQVAPVADEAVAARRTTRNITIEGKEPRPSQFFISGKIRPEYDRKQVIVERKVGNRGKYKTYKRIKTNGKSRYRTGVAELRSRGKVYYRTKTAATKNFKVSYSNGGIVIETY